MAALNEAYRVLRDPHRRAAYDTELRRPAPRQSSVRPVVVVDDRTPPAAPSPGPARFPWRLVAVMGGVGVGVVLAGAAMYEPAPPAAPDNVLQRGSCVAIEDNGDAREVTCRGVAGELVVEELVALDAICPPGLDAHRDRQGMGIACVTTRN